MSESAYTPGFFGVTPSAHCSRCGRALTNPVSVLRGIGPECSGRGYAGGRQKSRKEGSPGKGAIVKDVRLEYDEELDGAPGLTAWEHRYAGYHSPDLTAVCKVRAYISQGTTTPPDLVVLITEMPENEGLSVTNGIEKIATEVIRKLRTFTAAWNSLTWVEHYPDRHPPGMESDSMFDEVFAVVQFSRGDGLAEPFGGPTWKHVERDEFLAWIGRADVEIPA